MLGFNLLSEIYLCPSESQLYKLLTRDKARYPRSSSRVGRNRPDLQSSLPSKPGSLSKGPSVDLKYLFPRYSKSVRACDIQKYTYSAYQHLRLAMQRLSLPPSLDMYLTKCMPIKNRSLRRPLRSPPARALLG